MPSAPYENWKVATDEADCAAGPFATTAVPVGGSLSTVQVVLVGELMLPALSTERVWRVYAPSASPVNATGDAHGAHVPPGSSWHSSVVSGAAVTLKVASRDVVGSAGRPEMAGAGGGVRSTSQRMAVSALWTGGTAALCWRTSTSCAPSPRPLSDSGLVHVVHGPPSIEHSIVAPASSVRNRSAVVSLVGLPGMLSTATSGGAVADTVKSKELTGPVLPAASIWRVLKV